jgi:hypothetical protein
MSELKTRDVRGTIQSRYSAWRQEDYRRAKVNIIQDAKPNLLAKFSVNRAIETFGCLHASGV